MKIYHLFILILISGCSSDDDSSNNQQNITEEITGVWNLSDYSSDVFYDAVGEYLKRTGDNIDYTIEFKNSPKAIAISGKIEYLAEELIIGEILNYSGIINGELGEGHHTREWKISNRNLITKSTFFINGTEIERDVVTEIVELTANSLILKINYAQYSTQGNTISGNTILKYTR